MRLLRKLWNFYLDLVWYSMPGVVFVEAMGAFGEPQKTQAEVSQRECEKWAAANG